MNPSDSKPSPFISVVMPVYSWPSYVRKGIQSLLKQEYRDFEIVISDDSPSDEIRHIVGEFDSPQIRYIRHDAFMGLSEKLNFLLENSRGEWMVILGDDDNFEPGYLKAMAETVQKHPEAALVRTRFRFMLDDGSFLREAPDEVEKLDPPDFLNLIFLPWYQRFVNITGFFFRRRKLMELGGFILTEKGWNVDTAAWAWLGSQGPSYFESRPLINVRFAEGSAYKKFNPDYRAFIKSKRLFFDSMERLFRTVDAAAAAGDRRKIRRARRFFVRYWMREESKLRLDDVFIHFLRQDDATARKEIAEMIGALKQCGMPLTVPLFSFYGAIACLPGALRRAALAIFLDMRRDWSRFFPQERWLFFWKEMNLRTRLLTHWRRFLAGFDGRNVGLK